jgi:type IV secretory pathway TrbD component
MILIAVLIPWLSFFLRGKILSGLLCLFLQITLIGWLPVAIWAVVSRSNAVTEKRIRKMERRILREQRA